MKPWALLIFFALAGCKTLPAPEPVIMTKTVSVPVPVACKVTLPAEPVLPSKAVPLTGDVLDLTKLALMDRAELLAALAEWQAAARACASP